MLEQCNVVPFMLSDPKNLRNKKYNALAHILPEIGKVTCLTLKNVRDLDVEGHALVVQGL